MPRVQSSKRVAQTAALFIFDQENVPIFRTLTAHDQFHREVSCACHNRSCKPPRIAHRCLGRAGSAATPLSTQPSNTKALWEMMPMTPSVLRSLAVASFSTLLASAPALAVTVTNSSATEQSIGIDVGAKETVHKIPAGQSVTFAKECGADCAVTGPWGFSRRVKSGEMINTDGTSLVTTKGIASAPAAAASAPPPASAQAPAPTAAARAPQAATTAPDVAAYQPSARPKKSWKKSASVKSRRKRAAKHRTSKARRLPSYPVYK
jgi:hypothetical protein